MSEKARISQLGESALRRLHWERRARYLAANPPELQEALGASAPWLWAALEKQPGGVSFEYDASGDARAWLRHGGDQTLLEVPREEWLGFINALGARAKKNPAVFANQIILFAEIEAGGFNLRLMAQLTPSSRAVGAGFAAITAPDQFEIEAFRAELEREELMKMTPAATGPASAKPGRGL